MRQIEFRAWSDTEQQMLTMYDMRDFRFNEIEKMEMLDYHLMQYTGLKDKNGVEIYEGDIVRGAVITDDMYTWVAPALRYFHHWQETEDAIAEGKPIEVIGNIYENPELLQPTNSTKERIDE